MALTLDQHGDLRLRLEALVAEVAPASDRSGATAKLHEILARVPIGDDAGPTEGDIKQMVDEIDRRGQVISDLRAENTALHAANETGAQQLADTQRALDEAKKALEVAQTKTP